MDVFRSRYLMVMLSAILFLGGCVSMGELTDEVIKAGNAGREGLTRVYPVMEKQAWDLTVNVFRLEKADEIDFDEKGRWVIGRAGVNMDIFGSVMGVWIRSVDSGHTKLTVVTRRRAGDKFTKLTASNFYERFDQLVYMLRTEKYWPFVHSEYQRTRYSPM